MSDNSSSIKPTAVDSGFFTKTGQLKSKEQLKQNVEVSVNEDAASTSSSPEVVSKALTKVEDRFRSEVGSIADDVNRRAGQLKQAKESLKKEKQALQDLKQAFKDGDEEQAAKLQEDIQTIRTEREKNIEQVNREQRISSGPRTVRFGNKEINSVSIPELKFSEAKRESPTSVDEIKSQIDDINGEIDNLNGQKDGIKAARKVLAEAFNSGKDEIDRISDDSLKSLESAQQSVNKITSETKDLIKDELLSAVASKINPASVALALKG